MDFQLIILLAGTIAGGIGILIYIATRLNLLIDLTRVLIEGL